MALIKRTTTILVLILLTPAVIFSTENETGPRTLVRSSQNSPVAGSTWTLTLLIAHNEPNEVNVLAPHFGEAIFLEQVIKSPRFVNPDMTTHNEMPTSLPPEAIERWTAMEYRFVLSSPGTVSFDAFTVVTPQGQTKTAPFDLIVRRPQNTAEVQNHRFVWEGMPSELKAGENAVFALRYSGGNYAGPLPETRMFLPSVPPGHILESLPLTPEEKSVGIAFRLRLIPLEAAPFVLARRQFSHNGAIFEVPALRIPVIQSAEKNAYKEQTAPENGPPAPFPPLDAAIKDQPRLYQKYRNECETIYAAAKRLWDGGSRAGALAALRQNERDHPAGALFAIIRRGAEQALGFTGTGDEKRSFFRGNSRSAVLMETAVRQIPDRAGEEIARFREGQPVLLNRKTQHTIWLQVTANDNQRISGWVPEENIIFY